MKSAGVWNENMSPIPFNCVCINAEKKTFYWYRGNFYFSVKQFTPLFPICEFRLHYYVDEILRYILFLSKQNISCISTNGGKWGHKVNKWISHAEDLQCESAHTGARSKLFILCNTRAHANEKYVLKLFSIVYIYFEFAVPIHFEFAFVTYISIPLAVLISLGYVYKYSAFTNSVLGTFFQNYWVWIFMTK